MVLASFLRRMPIVLSSLLYIVQVVCDNDCAQVVFSIEKALLTSDEAANGNSGVVTTMVVERFVVTVVDLLTRAREHHLFGRGGAAAPTDSRRATLNTQAKHTGTTRPPVIATVVRPDQT